MPTIFIPYCRFRQRGCFFEGGHAQRAPLQILFPPFRIRFLVLDRSSNAERGSGGEVEMILNDRTNSHFTETTSRFCPLIVALFWTYLSKEWIEIPERTPSIDVIMAGRSVMFYCIKSSMMSFDFDLVKSSVATVIHSLWRRAKKHWSCLAYAVQPQRSANRWNFYPGTYSTCHPQNNWRWEF